MTYSKHNVGLLLLVALQLLVGPHMYLLADLS